ncbi:MAG: hypothetical protein J6B02_03315 [Selenomonadales bacterium]|nr:hypothetical protein [Selenomonadales bacterium]
MTFDEALARSYQLIGELETIERNEKLDRLVRSDAEADKVAIAIMVAWAKKAYEKNDACAMHILNALHSV